MADKYENDANVSPQEIAALQRKRLLEDGRISATVEVTPAMLVHRDDASRCICEACSKMRVKRALPTTLRERMIVRAKHTPVVVTDDVVGTPYGKRKPNRLNQPIRMPHFDNVPGLLRWMR